MSQQLLAALGDEQPATAGGTPPAPWGREAVSPLPTFADSCMAGLRLSGLRRNLPGCRARVALGMSVGRPLNRSRVSAPTPVVGRCV